MNVHLELVACLIALKWSLVFLTDDGYGTEWLEYVDENGTIRNLNFSSLPAERNGLHYGCTYFHLYTRRNPTNSELLTVPKNDRQIESSYFNESNNVKVLTHGWLSSGNTTWLLHMKNTYLDKYDTNVIVVDWSELAKNPVYPWSACSTRYVGKRVAKLLDSLIATYKTEGNVMHLIGHSLGAQVMGYAGMFSNNKIRRITGLDPARPLFEIPPMSNDFRLDKSDAAFVDIIHTSAGVLGYEYSHGHADYYPNSGKSPQPGCQGIQAAMDSCSHGRSYEYYDESIDSSVGFISYQCESWDKYENGDCKDNSSLMGDPADASSDLYLHTRNHSKYAEGSSDAK